MTKRKIEMNRLKQQNKATMKQWRSDIAQPVNNSKYTAMAMSTTSYEFLVNSGGTYRWWEVLRIAASVTQCAARLFWLPGCADSSILWASESSLCQTRMTWTSGHAEIEMMDITSRHACGLGRLDIQTLGA